MEDFLFLTKKKAILDFIALPLTIIFINATLYSADIQRYILHTPKSDSNWNRFFVFLAYFEFT